MSDGHELVATLEVIESDECVALLGTASVGRVGLLVDGRPEILPVNYALDDNRIVFRTAEGTVLHQASLAIVAFEVDQIDETDHSGWSVLVQGVAWEVSEAIDPTSERLRHLSLMTWAPGARHRWFSIRAGKVTGRRIRLIPSPAPVETAKIKTED